MAPRKLRVLFVCTGNICRSPTAEGVFRHLASQRKGAPLGFETDSAGTASSHVGEPPDPRAIAVAKRNGVDISDLRARDVKPSDFSDFDHIFAMDSGHMRALKARAPAKSRAALHMFLAQGDVPDPWYGSEHDFIEVFDMVHKRAQTLLAELEQEHKP
jgi:protein-tyrosine phosphatase